MKNNPTLSIPDILNQTFHDVDSHLSKLAEDAEGKMHSGCTAVTAFLRIEDLDGKQTFLESYNSDGTMSPSPERTPSPVSPTSTKHSLNTDGTVEDSGTESPSENKKGRKRNKLKDTLKSLSRSPVAVSPSQPVASTTVPPFTPIDSNLRRVLYCANAGDARGVLCRGGKAIRLTYDHKGSDKQEAKRIMDAGGFVMSGRVNGVLAVTRSLGDSSMKEFVVGAPYTTETELAEEDEFIILACDGVSYTTRDSGAADARFPFALVVGYCRRQGGHRSRTIHQVSPRGGGRTRQICQSKILQRQRHRGCDQTERSPRCERGREVLVMSHHVI